MVKIPCRCLFWYKNNHTKSTGDVLSVVKCIAAFIEHRIDFTEEKFIFKIINQDTLQKPDKDIKQTDADINYKEATRAFPLYNIRRFSPI